MYHNKNETITIIIGRKPTTLVVGVRQVKILLVKIKSSTNKIHSKMNALEFDWPDEHGNHQRSVKRYKRKLHRKRLKKIFGFDA